jgi:hypothetical protein
MPIWGFKAILPSGKDLFTPEHIFLLPRGECPGNCGTLANHQGIA